MNKNNILTSSEMKEKLTALSGEEAQEEKAERENEEDQGRRVPTWIQKPPPKFHGKDRANQEVFISQNGDRNLKYFPSDDAYRDFSRNHLPALQSTRTTASKTVSRMDERPKKHQFW
jgi:hypothetical protein